MIVKYRTYRPADHTIVVGCIKNFYKEYSGTIFMDHDIENTIESLFNHSDRGTIIVFENDNVIIGYSLLINFWSNEYKGNILYIDEIYVLPEYRSQGIGSRFVKYIINSKFNNYVALHLEVSPQNKKAKKLYEQLGFKPYQNEVLIYQGEV